MAVKTRLIDRDVLNVLGAAECDGMSLRLTGQLDRDLYVRTNKVLEALGGKWNRSAKAHLFEMPAAERMEQAILTGAYENHKQDFGFFETPIAITREFLLPRASIAAGMQVLEPSAGRGAIANQCREAGATVSCVEIQQANCEALAKERHEVLSSDFLLLDPAVHRKFDRVVMNPPFAARADIRHITHAAKFLAPDGILVAVASASVSFRSDLLAHDFRALVEERNGEIIDLPEGSFKSSGTMVNTVVVTLAGSAS